MGRANFKWRVSCSPSQGSYWEIDPTPLEESSDTISLSGFPRKRKVSDWLFLEKKGKGERYGLLTRMFTQCLSHSITCSNH